MMSDVKDILDTLKSQNAQILEKLSALNIKPPEEESDTVSQHGAGGGVPSPTDVGFSADLGTAGNIAIQEEYLTIKDCVQNVKLSADLKVSESRSGIKREDTAHANVIGKCAKFAETSMKLILQADKREFDENSKNELLYKMYSVQLAQIRYLQEEHASVIVQGQFDKDTARLFRSMQRNTAEFSPAVVSTLQHAAAISASRQQCQRRPFGRRFNFNRGRGGFRGRDSYNQFHFNRRDNGHVQRPDTDLEQ